MAGISCAGFTFYNEFDSANLAKVEQVPNQNNEIVAAKHLKNALLQEVIDVEFNIWTKPDCYGTEFENGNRTWFYFGLKAPTPALLVKFNIVDLNRQGKMYSQGMAPVYRMVPGKPRWDRIPDKPTYSLNDDIFTLSFKFRTLDNLDSVIYFAFTYPFSVTELEKMLNNVDAKYLNMKRTSDDDIYYVRETVCHSCDGKPIDLITISSHHGISKEREDKLKNLFNRSNVPRPYKFPGKKVIFVSARVHPGETPSSFVFNGLLSLLLSKDDLVGQFLRKMYVFKLIPFLNPDGVSRGHYRTDSRGVNLNRVYLNPSLTDHPSVYAARALIRFYHFGYEKEDVIPKCENCKAGLPGNRTDASLSDDDVVKDDAIRKKVSRISLNEDKPSQTWCTKWHNFCRNCGAKLEHTQSKEEVQFEKVVVGAHGDINSNESGLFLYIDLHGHASKKGIFMYGNHFDDVERNVECMLLPKLMSINNHNFHFHACNFTERNMYLRDKRDGMSRAGSGRVAVLSLTGIIKSYTLECNYNTGRLVNVLPPTIKEPHGRMHTVPVPPKYTPQIFEEVGRSLGASILDLTGSNPFTRLSNSEFHSLNGLRDWLRTMARELTESRPRKGKTGNLTQGKAARTMLKTRSLLPKSLPKKVKTRSAPIPLDRKENLAQSSTSKTSMKVSKSPFKAKTRKELTLKSKNSAEKLKPVGKVVKKPVSAGASNPSRLKLDNPQTAQSDNKPKDDGVHLREICFINNSEGKAVIAKYENDDNFDDSLVVAWEKNSTHPQLYTRKARVFSAPPYHLPNKSYSEPSTSKQGGTFRVHNFAKTKAKKNLRRLASAADILGKVDKKKKKKLKAK